MVGNWLALVASRGSQAQEVLGTQQKRCGYSRGQRVKSLLIQPPLRPSAPLVQRGAKRLKPIDPLWLVSACISEQRLCRVRANAGDWPGHSRAPAASRRL